MLDLAQQGAEVLRSTDPYQDRTGDLRESTEAVIDQSGDPVIVVLRMGEDYASFVKRLGYSNFDDVSEEVKRQMDDGMRTVRRRIGG